MTEPNYAAEMKLPAGITCADCQHGHRCDALFGAVRRAFTSCDFWPSRFVPAAALRAIASKGQDHAE
jgi:hypothetical protein